MKIVLAVSMLCAASASMANPELSNEGYGRLAGQWFATEQCAIQGRISPETAAFGKKILREAQERYEVDKAHFNLLVAAVAKKFANGLNPRICNQIAMEIEDIRLQRSTAAEQAQLLEQQRRAAQAQAQLEEQQRLKAQTQAQLEQQQRREAQMEAQMEAQRQRQEAEAEAAYRRNEVQRMTEQIKQIGQQFRDFGNSVQPRTTDCTRTMMGASCTTY